ncbi:MAG: HigA family addiction module antidote protein [Magnetococcales bacterium]|nr:HigA family addiction module antidote protein [Magnetococcales bacterium]
MDTTARRPIYPIHPGTVLADELEELGMSAADLARAIHVPSNRIYQLIAGKRAMTADTAIRLEQWLGVEAAFWLNLQKTYELDVAMAESGERIRGTIVRLNRQVQADVVCHA